MGVRSASTRQLRDEYEPKGTKLGIRAGIDSSRARQAGKVSARPMVASQNQAWQMGQIRLGPLCVWKCDCGEDGHEKICLNYSLLSLSCLSLESTNQVFNNNNVYECHLEEEK